MKCARTLALLVALTAASARADDFPVDLRVDLPVTGAAVLGWVLGEVWVAASPPASCRWCDSNGLDETIRTSLRWGDVGLARTLSNVSAFAAAPAFALGLPALLGTRPTDHLLVLESASLAVALNQAVKLIALRRRPGAHGESDQYLSFFSGHTTFTFALAVSSGTIASLRGTPGAGWVWAAGLLTAAATGYLRIAADQHYFSDVAVGALVGSAIGLIVPWLHRRTEGPRFSAAPVPGGGILLLQL